MSVIYSRAGWSEQPAEEAERVSSPSLACLSVRSLRKLPAIVRPSKMYDSDFN